MPLEGEWCSKYAFWLSTTSLAINGTRKEPHSDFVHKKLGKIQIPKLKIRSRHMKESVVV